MTRQEAKAVLRAISGYWPTPAMTKEEVTVFFGELEGPYTLFEARAVIRAEAKGGRIWRPRPGELVELIFQYRRQVALRQPHAALPSGERRSDRQASLEAIAACREILTAAD